MLGHTTVWQCSTKSCKLQFAEPQLDDVALANAYSRLYYPNVESGSPSICENTSKSILVQLFKKITKRLGNSDGRTCLDYGCGKGNLGVVAREFGWIPKGVEADPQGCEEALRNLGAGVYRNLDDLLQAEPSARFDLITLWQVIEHLRTPWLDLERLRPLLKLGGIVVISTPNADGLRAHMLRRRSECYQNVTHFYYFGPSSMMAVLHRSGFSRFERWHDETFYEHHGFIRSTVQKALVAFRLNGELLFEAS